MKRRLAALAMLVLASGCASVTAPVPDPVDTVGPAFRREMRGLWVATVANIDWPSRKGLSAQEQKAELISILDRAREIGFNTVILQIRPAADALYESSLEPWAAWLTGSQGQHPGYDPLAFAVTEAHARGLQLHAWINPFRAGNTADSSVLAPNHVFNSRRDLVRVYGGNLWMDPGAPESQERSIQVARDLVTRYDIDGIHADDYFYPYQIRNAANQLVDFPDDSTYAVHGAGQDRGDWRRANIDRFVERMYREVHAIKPGVLVGLSPFGIWRPNFPAGVQGLDAFASINADSRKWLQQGWVDYFIPQLYWAIAAPQQSFPALLDWWSAENVAKRHVWPGLAAYRVQNGSATAFTLDEIPAQMRIVREKLPLPGEVFYNTTSTLYRLDGAIGDRVKAAYAIPAIVPSFPWLDSIAPETPTISVEGAKLRITPAGEIPRWWLIRQHIADGWSWRGRRSARWTTKLVFAATTELAIEGGADHVIVQAIDQAGNESAATEWRKQP